MKAEPELLDSFKSIILRKGSAGLEEARKEILSSKYKKGPVLSATKYFARVTLHGGLPVFPALVSLSCEAVGGKTEKTTSIAAALILIAGAADIHDDIIDKSASKYSKKTIFGKFGGDVALLAGDALLILGTTFLFRECEKLPKEQRNAILGLVPEALFEISNAEAMETGLMKNSATTPQEYLKIIRLKSVVPELHCKIGAILGNGKKRDVEILGNYGRTFGIVSLIREEFIDLIEYQELVSRLQNECVPLPILCALQNPKNRKEIISAIENENITENNMFKIVDAVLEAKEVQELKSIMNGLIEREITELKYIKSNLLRNKLSLILRAVGSEV
ncbi:MAG: polyprenyl synthetase family protein [Candidatus Bathyarchaeota archaeon]|nr:polyprenyl synthetase family protein [Candidatus Bathyarchaeota archaeon]